MPSKHLAKASALLGRRLDELSRVSDERGATTRTFLSPAMRRANGRVGGWMKQAGLSVREDSVGNLIGTVRGTMDPGHTLLLGSHLDTVHNAGRFDGTLGVLLPIAAMEVLRAEGTALPFSVEIVGFSEEEGVRFASAYIGSKGYTGTLTKADLRHRDEQGVSVGDALREFNQGKTALPSRAHDPKNLLGYLEVHIEQGPVLESLGKPLGVVPAIAGQTRALVHFTGKAGHAGTTPMALRKDALAGAAEFILAVEAHAAARPPLVATVGRATAKPGAANVIAGSAELTLDVRHPSDARRRSALARIGSLAHAIARKRGLRCELAITQDNGAVRCSGALTARLRQSVEAVQGSCPEVPSGAGHDAVVVSTIAPVAMLFVRCRDGLSHHPDESVLPGDLRASLAAVVDFLRGLAASHAP